MIAAAVRTIFVQPSPVHVRDQLEVIAAMLGRQVWGGQFSGLAD
jgi:hypothetical protein